MKKANRAATENGPIVSSETVLPVPRDTLAHVGRVGEPIFTLFEALDA